MPASMQATCRSVQARALADALETMPLASMNLYVNSEYCSIMPKHAICTPRTQTVLHACAHAFTQTPAYVCTYAWTRHIVHVQL
jgi:hypothetical protein